MQTIRYGKLSIIESRIYTSKSGVNSKGYLCMCDCGNFKIVRKSDLVNGKVKSCGCMVREFNKTKIGNRYAALRDMSNCYKHMPFCKRVRSIWKNMKSRCENKNATSYEHYGGRGIKVCEEWSKFINFYNWAMSHGYADDLTIDRIDVNGNYEPDNCRWSTIKEQSRNKRTNHYITIEGKTRCVADWSDLLGISEGAVIRRYS